MLDAWIRGASWFDVQTRFGVCTSGQRYSTCQEPCCMALVPLFSTSGLAIEKPCLIIYLLLLSVKTVKDDLQNKPASLELIHTRPEMQPGSNQYEDPSCACEMLCERLCLCCLRPEFVDGLLWLPCAAGSHYRPSLSGHSVYDGLGFCVPISDYRPSSPIRLVSTWTWTSMLSSSSHKLMLR